MKKFALTLTAAAMLITTAQAATVDFSSSTGTPSQAAIDAGAPAGGIILDAFATTDADILSVNQVLIDLTAGTMFQVAPPFGSDTAPPDPAFLALNAALEADSWITTPGATSLLGPGLDNTDGTSSFGDLTNDGAQANFNFARLGFSSDAVGTFSGRVSVAGTSGPEVFPFSFSIGGTVTPIVPTPAPGALDLGMIVAAGGLVEDAITFANGAPTDLSFSNQSIANLFYANIDGSNVDIGVDMALAQTFPAGTVATADLSINGEGGPFNYAVSGVIPEPTTLALLGLGVVGLIARRK